jgi:hypothetical protein
MTTEDMGSMAAAWRLAAPEAREEVRTSYLL